ncbi:hypothetical protein FGO68_gene5365 [Halteria grandinella]|uniref:Uncharacterized protein n=1 Tax=Halteria grandinella TaxID=5974 RepID=A0A8J8SYU4_HALGN|nr:hypothetical protein FGO68_gene5365 [Halteria grandinella]
MNSQAIQRKMTIRSLLTLSTCSGRYSRDAWHLFNEANRILNVIAWYPSHAKLRVFREVTFELNKITQNLLTEVMGYEQMCNSMKVQLQEAVSQVNESTRAINEQINAAQGIYSQALIQEYQAQKGKIQEVIKQNEISEQMMKQLATGKRVIEERLYVYWCYTKMGRYGLEEWNDAVYESSL